MAQAQLATRIDERVKGAVEKICKARGQKMNHFIEEALLDKLETRFIISVEKFVCYLPGS